MGRWCLYKSEQAVCRIDNSKVVPTSITFLYMQLKTLTTNPWCQPFRIMVLGYNFLLYMRFPGNLMRSNTCCTAWNGMVRVVCTSLGMGRYADHHVLGDLIKLIKKFKENGDARIQISIKKEKKEIRAREHEPSSHIRCHHLAVVALQLLSLPLRHCIRCRHLTIANMSPLSS